MKKARLFAMLFLCLLLIVFLSLPISAAGNAVVSISAPTVIVGNQVSVQVKVTAPSQIGSWDFTLNYNSEFLTYKTGGDSGGAGKVRFVNAGPVDSVSYTVVFTTNKVGNTALSVKGSESDIVDYDSTERFSVSDANFNLRIDPQPVYSGDNNLSSLSVSSGTLEPVFSADKTDYTLSVPYEITNLIVSAQTAHNRARINVSNTNLSVGENTITVTVTAENGNRKDYRLHVTRLQSDLAGITTQIGSETYTFEHDPSYLAVPDGFQEKIINFSNNKIMAFVSPKDSVTIAYLKGENHSGWFVLDEKNQSFFPMQMLSGETSSILILPRPEEIAIPFGYVSCQIEIKGIVYSAFKTEHSAEKDVYLIYGMIQDGTIGYFFFDLVHQNFVSYFHGTVLENTVVGGELHDPELESKLQFAEFKANRMIIVSLILGLVCVFLGITSVLLWIFRRRKKTIKTSDDDFFNQVNSDEKNVQDILDVYNDKK